MPCLICAPHDHHVYMLIVPRMAAEISAVRLSCSCALWLVRRLYSFLGQGTYWYIHHTAGWPHDKGQNCVYCLFQSQVLILLGLAGMFGNQVSHAGEWRLYTKVRLTIYFSQLLYILGVYWAGPDIASAFQPIIPVWTTILAILTCTEKVPSPFLVSFEAPTPATLN